jgi:hypothetical protein
LQEGAGVKGNGPWFGMDHEGKGFKAYGRGSQCWIAYDKEKVLVTATYGQDNTLRYDP